MIANIIKTVETLFDPDDVIEVRLLKSTGPLPRISRSEFLFAHQIDKLAAIIEKKNINDYYNCYVCLNPLKAEMIQHQHNKAFDKSEHVTTDNDIDKINFLFIDLDPIRSKGFEKYCSTYDELSICYDTGHHVVNCLSGHGIVNPIVGMSGNGLHLLYNVESSDDVFEDAHRNHTILNILNSKFSTEQVEIDTAVANPGRIIKLYGTIAYKGPRNNPIRPARQSKILHIPDKKITPISVLDAFIDKHHDIVETIARKSDETDVSGILNMHANINMHDVNYALSEIIYPDPYLLAGYENGENGDRSKVEINFMSGLFRRTSDIHLVSAVMNFRNSGSWRSKKHSHRNVLEWVLRNVGYNQAVYDEYKKERDAFNR